VKNLTPYGVFVELSSGIGGMVHISDLSWTKRFNHPSEYTKVGTNLDVVVMEIDAEGRKLSLGHKQLEENPWDTFETVFPVGSYHEATVTRKDDRGYTVQLPYGLEAYAPVKHMKKDDNTQAAMDEILTVKVIEFNRDDKKIVVSHAKFNDDVRKEADETVKKEKEVEKLVTKKAVEKVASKVEMTTLGEIEGFSALKEQLQENAKAKLEASTTAKESDNAAAPVAEPEAVVEQVVETVVVETPAVTETVVEATISGKADDLKIIEGIGPKIAELLNADGIITFKDLAGTSVERIQGILDAAGPRYRMHDPSTWPNQSQLAADGKMDELKILQDNLKGGKVE
jgi:ribosomal protein S1